MGLPATKTTAVSNPVKKLHTLEEYFAFSADTDRRYEFEYGEFVAMGLTTDTHEDLAFNMKVALKKAVKGRNCRVHKESVALEVEENGRYFLPDVMLTCDERDHQDRKIKRYPGLVVEVISPGSVKRDRDDKFRAYLQLPSLRYYLLVAQDQVRIEVFSKMEGPGWAFNYYESLEAVISLDQLEMELKVADVYAEVNLTPEVEESGEAETESGEGEK